MTFMDAKSGYMKGESQVTWSDSSPLAAGVSGANVFEIDDFNFDFEQVINISSQSSGGGAGKVTFNPFTINRKFDRASPTFMTMCCAGTHFKEVSLLLRRAGAGATTTSTTVSSGTTFLRFDFAMVLIKTISFSGADGDEAMKEEVAFEYGAVKFRYLQQNPDGSYATSGTGAPVAMWNRVNNNNDYDTFLNSFTAKS
jgi:type VI secretion system Hcp family effector